MKRVECVPNFSEGRRPEVVQQIVNSMTGVQILGYESDTDHNRSVVTVVGSPEAVLEAVFNAIATAAKLIDLDVHQGGHPRLGATDVVPFIPIEDMTMQECVELAQQLGQRVGDELGIPVYLYEAAATRPDRENLADVRRGEYEQLKEEMGQNPKRTPDYGPAIVGKAGATIIGARAPLIAYNVYLTTTDVEIAKKIAKSIRHSSGGLHFVKAMGLMVDGKAQVSMNLTDYTQTPIHRAVEMIRREAARYGVGIESSELIGLIPQQALFDSAQWYLQIDNFKRDQVLEVQLEEKVDHHGVFLSELASDKPAPGGGSAAAYSGAMAAGLVAMVARLTVGKKKYADVDARMTEIIEIADDLRNLLQANVQRDADAFNVVMTAYRMPKSTEEEQANRDQAIQHATIIAAEVPLETAIHASAVLTLAAEVAETGNTNAITDAGSAGSLALTALYAAGLNVKINAANVNPMLSDDWRQALKELEDRAEVNMGRIHAAIASRGGI